MGSDPNFSIFVNVGRLKLAATVILWLMATSAFAQQPPTMAGMPADTLPAAIREVGFDQNLGQQLPLEVEFRNEHGAPVRLGDYFGKRPVVLAFVYYGCPMLCLQSLSSLASTLGVLTEEPGRQFELVTISIDPRETPQLALEKKSHYVERSGKPSIARGWHFLTGTEASIQRVTKSAGFRYVWDDKLQQFAHPAGIVIASSSGTLARYLFGIDFGPRDLRLAVLDATEGHVSSPIAKALLYCYHYDISSGRYSLAIMRIVQIAGIATVLTMGTLIFIWTRRERRPVI